MNRKCIVMYSGGLDSAIAVHLLKSLGLDVTALHYILPFASGLGFKHSKIERLTEALGVPLRIEEEGQEFLDMVSDPRYGYGKNANPCLDCRIHRLTKAKKIMEETGASFIATGEVVGQRPKSQRKDCLDTIEVRTGLKGLLLRPLCAHLLAPTIPEQQGWVDRSKLMGMRGRGRRAQLAYAKQHSLQHTPPAGGCILTDIVIANRFLRLKEQQGNVSLSDFKLIAYGRHVQISPTARMIIGRFDAENEIMLKLVEPQDQVMLMEDVLGPLGLGKGTFTQQDILTAASVLARYSKVRAQPVARVSVKQGALKQIVEVEPADIDSVEKMII